MTAIARLALVASLSAVAVAGCKNPVGVTVPLGGAGFILAPNVVAAVGSDGLRLEFLRVSGDSRCPVDAVCIQGGDAVVHVRAEDGSGGAELELHTGDTARASATFRAYTVTLVDVHPYPFSGRTIAQKDYRITIRVINP